MSQKKKGSRVRVTSPVRILSERREILGHLALLDRNNLTGERGRAAGDNTPWADPLDQAHAATTETEALATRQVLASRLATLARAAEKLREGTHGLCDDCGRPIPAARLRAMPEATLCVPCAEETDHRSRSAPRQVR